MKPLSLRKLDADDVFISYSREDGETYLNGLSEALTKLGFRCFDDRYGTEAVTVPPETLLRKIRNCRTFVLLATPGAIAKSRYLAEEANVFAKANGTTRIIAVSFDRDTDALDDWSQADWVPLVEGKSRAREFRESIETGTPSTAVVSRIEKESKYLKSNDRLRRYRNGAAFVLTGLMIAAFVAGFIAWKQVNRASDATQIADRETLRASEATKAASEALGKLKDAEAKITSANQALEKATTEAQTKAALAESASRTAQTVTNNLRIKQRDLDTAQTSLQNAQTNLTKANADLLTARNKVATAEDRLKSANNELATAQQETIKQKELADKSAKEAKRGTIRFYQERGRENLLNGNAQGGLVYLNKAYQMAHETTVPSDFRKQSLAFLISSANKSLIGQVASLNGHENRITTGRFSPDNQRVVTVSDDGTAKVWSATDGKLLGTLEGQLDFESGWTGTNRIMLAAYFSPDGSRILTINRSTVRPDDAELVPHDEVYAQLWDGRTYTGVSSFEFKLGDDEYDGRLEPCFNQDGKTFDMQVIDRSDGYAVKVFNLVDGKEIEDAKPKCHTASEAQITLKQKTSYIEIKDPKTGRMRSFDTKESNIKSVIPSPDGKRFVTTYGEVQDNRTSVSKVAKLWDGAKVRSIAKLEGHLDSITNVVFSPDGEVFVTTSKDGTAKVWASANGALIASLAGHQDSVIAAAFNSNGKQLLTTGEDNRAIVWNWAEAAPPLLIALNQVGPYAVFSDAGQQVVAGSVDGGLATWQISAKTQARTSLPNGEKIIALSPAGNRVITRGPGGVKLFDTATGKRIDCKDLEPAVKVAFSDNGQYIVATITNNDPTVNQVDLRVVDAFTGKPKEEDTGLGYVNALGSADAADTVAVDSTGTLVFMAVDLNKEMWISPSNDWDPMYPNEDDRHKGNVTLAMFSPDDKYLLTCSEDKTIKLWSTKTRKRLKLLHTLKGHTGEITSIRFSGDNKSIVSTSVDGSAKVWDIASGSLVASLDGHKGHVNMAAFSPDNQRIATAGSDGTVKLWDAVTGDLLSSIDGNGGAVRSLVFHQKEDMILTTNADAVMRIWDLRYNVPDALALAERVKRITSLEIVNDQLVPTVGTPVKLTNH